MQILARVRSNFTPNQQMCRTILTNSSSDISQYLISERQVRESETAQRAVIRDALIEAEKALETKVYSEKSVKTIMEEVLERKRLYATSLK